LGGKLVGPTSFGIGVAVGGAGVNVTVGVGLLVGDAVEVGLNSGVWLTSMMAVGCGAGLVVQATSVATSRQTRIHLFDMMISLLLPANSRGNHTAKLAFLTKNPIIQIIWKAHCQAFASKAPPGKF
jgi:hypothetical protein